MEYFAILRATQSQKTGFLVPKLEEVHIKNLTLNPAPPLPLFPITGFVGLTFRICIKKWLEQRQSTDIVKKHSANITHITERLQLLFCLKITEGGWAKQGGFGWVELMCWNAINGGWGWHCPAMSPTCFSSLKQWEKHLWGWPKRMSWGMYDTWITCFETFHYTNDCKTIGEPVRFCERLISDLPSSIILDIGVYQNTINIKMLRTFANNITILSPYHYPENWSVRRHLRSKFA